jgi:putative membrane protein
VVVVDSAAVVSVAAAEVSAAAALQGVGDMAFLSETEKATLSAKINHAESRTRAEIVTVIAQTSDGYRYIPTLWAALAALSAPGLYYLWSSLNSDGWVTTELADNASYWLYSIQVLLFLGLGMIFQIPKARLWMIPKRVKRQRAARHAREQFFLQNLHETKGRTGILIFVSVAEHYVEIIVDTAVADVVDNHVWNKTVEKFIEHLRTGDISKGFESTIEQCRQIAWEHFPAPDGRPDELPNHLIEV